MKKTLEGPQHFLDIENLNREQLDHVLQRSHEIRTDMNSENSRSLLHRIFGAFSPNAGALQNRRVAFISSKESMRTKGSIDAASAYLGGGMTFFGKESLFDELGKTRESLQDITGCLDGMGFPIIFARLHGHADILSMASMAKNASVVNALTDQSHPLQALADVASFQHERPNIKNPKFVFAGDGNNVATSLAEATMMKGWEFVHTGPEERKIRPDRWEGIQNLASEYGGKAVWEPNPDRAAEGAHMIYGDVFASMSEKGKAEALRQLLIKYQITEDLFKNADPDAVFSHCLPAIRGEEVTTEVADGLRSIIYTTAGYRTYTTAAIMELLMSGRQQRMPKNHFLLSLLRNLQLTSSFASSTSAPEVPLP